MQALIDIVGRFIFGSFALLATCGFGAIFVVLAQANPANLIQGLIRYVLMDLIVIVVAFLLLAVLKFWTTFQWVDRLLASVTLKAGLVIVGFALAIITVGIVKQVGG